MLAIKGFNSKLQATLGKGTFQFEPGVTYEEEACKCASNGFHCAEDPLCAFGYYSSMDARYFVIRAEGDINQDGSGRISCTRITLVKEITRIELAAQACRYMEKYPEREVSSNNLFQERGKCTKKNDFIIVRGKRPAAAGVKGSYLFLMQEKPKSKEIKLIYPVFVDGEEVRENTYYGLKGTELCEKKN